MAKLPTFIALVIILFASVWAMRKIGAELSPALALKSIDLEGATKLAASGDFTMTAPKFPGNFTWLNSKPLGEKDLRGRVVLLDFWTYCCINCMHIIPDLKYLEEKYKDDPSVGIGVHSAKFDNEENAENIRHAILRYGVKHPVVVDTGMRIWTEYGVHAWPTLVLVTPDGKIAGSVSGEGNRDTLDEAVATLLAAYGKENKLADGPPEISPESFESDTGLFFPGKVFFDGSEQRLFVSDSGNHRIIVADAVGEVLDIAGSGIEGFKDGLFGDAEFRRPQGLALDGSILYVADTENHAIRKLDLVARTVETVAGTGRQMLWGGQGGPGRETDISSPWDVLLSGRVLYIAMAGSHQIWSYNLDSGRVDVFAGSGREARADGLRLTAAFAQPSGLALLDGKLYVADSEISSIREIDLAKGNVKTVAGGDLFDFGDVDGAGDRVRFQHPLGVAALGGAIYVADSYNHKVRRLDPKTREVSSYSGTGKPGYKDGELEQAAYSEPGGISAGAGKLYLADTNNHLIRVVDVKNQAVSTLKFPDLKDRGPKQKQQENVDSAYWAGYLSKQDFWAGAIPIKPGFGNGKSVLYVDLSFPDGWHLNEGLPVTIILDGGDAGIEFYNTKFDFPAKGLKPPVVIPFDVTGVGKIESAKLYVQVSGLYCDDEETVCVPFEQKYSIALSGYKKGTVNIVAEISEPDL